MKGIKDPVCNMTIKEKNGILTSIGGFTRRIYEGLKKGG
jgi:hypothetical protein